MERGMAMNKSTYLKNVKHMVSVTMAGVLAISGMLNGGITTNAEVGRGIQTGAENEMLPEEDAKKIASLHEPISDEGQERSTTNLRMDSPTREDGVSAN